MDNTMDRVNFRVHRDLKSIMRHAAMVNGQNLTDFILASALEKARTIIQTHEEVAKIVLSERDFEVIIQDLAEDDAPSENLVRLMKSTSV